MRNAGLDGRIKKYANDFAANYYGGNLRSQADADKAALLVRIIATAIDGWESEQQT